LTYGQTYGKIMCSQLYTTKRMVMENSWKENQNDSI
jgi:hypothetical protein